MYELIHFERIYTITLDDSGCMLFSNEKRLVLESYETSDTAGSAEVTRAFCMSLGHNDCCNVLTNNLRSVSRKKHYSTDSLYFIVAITTHNTHASLNATVETSNIGYYDVCVLLMD